MRTGSIVLHELALLALDIVLYPQRSPAVQRERLRLLREQADELLHDAIPFSDVLMLTLACEDLLRARAAGPPSLVGIMQQLTLHAALLVRGDAKEMSDREDSHGS